jgi:glycosyltransferase involved in cell wall biosynthesis
MSAGESIAVTIPAYQAEPFVGDVIHRAKRIVDHVLVVDDGSTDDTAGMARTAGARVLRHETNRGKGCALKTAFDDLFGRGAEYVVTLDADGQHLPENIPRLVRAIDDGADLIIGSRDHLFAEMHGVRRVSNRVSSYLISSLAGELLPDVQSGFRIYSRRLIEQIGFPESRFEAESAVVVRARRLGFRIVCVPIELGFADGRATSHYRPFVDSLRIATAVTRARMEAVGCYAERTS